MEEKNTNATKRRNPVTWVPSVYFAMGLPFVVLNMVTVLMFKGLDISDAQIALWTSVNHVTLDLKAFMEPVFGNVSYQEILCRIDPVVIRLLIRFSGLGVKLAEFLCSIYRIIRYYSA